MDYDLANDCSELRGFSGKSISVGETMQHIEDKIQERQEKR